jgi:BTB/POZ domain
VKLYFEQIRFHKAILSAHCKGFADLLHSNADNSSSSSSSSSVTLGEDLTQLLGVGSISADAFRAMLKFVYYGDTSTLTPRLACEVAPLANRLLMHDLAKLCHQGMDHVDSTNVLTVLQMSHESPDKDMQALKQKALEYVYEHVLDIDLAPLAELDATLAVDVLNVFKAHRELEIQHVAVHHHHEEYYEEEEEEEEEEEAVAEEEDGEEVDGEGEEEEEEVGAVEGEKEEEQ